MKTNIILILFSIVIVILSVIIIYHYGIVDKNNSICEKLEIQIEKYKKEERDILFTMRIDSSRIATSSEISYLRNLGIKLSTSNSGNSISIIYLDPRDALFSSDKSRYFGNVQFLSQPATIFHEGKITIRQNNRIVNESVSEYIYSLTVYENVGYEYYDNKRKIR